MVREALDGAGGVEYLQRCAETQPVAFLALVAKFIPSELKASLEGNVPLVLVRDYSGLAHELPIPVPVNAQVEDVKTGQLLESGPVVDVAPEEDRVTVEI